MADAPPRLPDSAAALLYDLERRLREGFTGEVKMECSQGGVRWVAYTETFKPDQLVESGRVA